MFDLVGKITGVNSSGTIADQVVAGNRPVKPYIGKTLAIRTTAATRFLLRQVNNTALPSHSAIWQSGKQWAFGRPGGRRLARI